MTWQMRIVFIKIPGLLGVHLGGMSWPGPDVVGDLLSGSSPHRPCVSFAPAGQCPRVTLHLLTDWKCP